MQDTARHDARVPITVVSGGQTGVDRAALDAALAAGIACGGWCPRGRKAEDGPLPKQYPLSETDSGDYAERTRCNVVDSDATVIVCFGPPRGGTRLTLDTCRREGRPCLLLDGDRLTPRDAAGRIAAFCTETGARRVNFAGPRASGEARAYPFTRAAVAHWLAGPVPAGDATRSSPD